MNLQIYNFIPYKKIINNKLLKRWTFPVIRKYWKARGHRRGYAESVISLRELISREAKFIGKLRAWDRVMRDGKSGCWPSERKRKQGGRERVMSDRLLHMYVSLQRVQWNLLCFGSGKPVYNNLVLETLSTLIRWPDWSRVQKWWKWLSHFGPWSIRSLVTSDL